MTVLALRQFWINRLDTGASLAAWSDPDRPQEYSTAQDVRTYASGRQRAVSTVGERGQVQVTLVMLTLANVQTLRDLSAQSVAVQARDHRGQRWFGVFDAVAVKEYRDPNLYAASITIRTITWDEGV